MTLIHSTCRFCGKPVTRRKQAASRNVQVHYCDNECKSQWQRAQKPVDEAWLREHYIDKGLDCVQIGAMVERDPKGVWRWLKDYGIPTRPRGTATQLKWDKEGSRPPARIGWNHTPETRKRLSEIAIADGRVPYDPAVGSYMKGKRGAQATRWKGGITPERQAFYSSEEWKSVSKEVVKRDKYTCQRCGKKKKKGDGEPFDIHHIVSFVCVSLRAVLSNLVYLCEPCHYWCHSKENVNREFIKEEGEE